MFDLKNSWRQHTLCSLQLTDSDMQSLFCGWLDLHCWEKIDEREYYLFLIFVASYHHTTQ